jgi:hypothetical protein
VKQGGNLIATGHATRATVYGDPRPDFGLADILGAHLPSGETRLYRGNGGTAHSYLRLLPELRASVYGPRTGNEPDGKGQRHPVLEGFHDTDLLPFGGSLKALKVDDPGSVPATFVPAFPIYPPETAWMREPKTDIAAIMARELANGSRVVFMPADLDRRYARDRLPDQKQLLENAVRWAARGNFPLAVSGPGILDCNLYKQQDRLVLHLVNLTTAAQMPVEEIIPVGPLRISIDSRLSQRKKTITLLFNGGSPATKEQNGRREFVIDQVALHEVAVFE